MFFNITLAPVYITGYLWADILSTKIIWTYKIVTATNNGVVRFIFPHELRCFESFNIQSNKNNPIENLISHCGIMIYVKYLTSTVVKNNL
jgi:hypothetical protein